MTQGLGVWGSTQQFEKRVANRKLSMWVFSKLKALVHNNPKCLRSFVKAGLCVLRL